MKTKIKVDKNDEKRIRAILDCLRTHGRSSTTRISFIALGHTDLSVALRYLEQLYKEGLVEKEYETNATYWKIKEVKK